MKDFIYLLFHLLTTLAKLTRTVIACIEDQDIIDKILAHLRDTDPTSSTLTLLTPPSRAPPEALPLFAGSEPTNTTLHQQGRY